MLKKLILTLFIVLSFTSSVFADTREYITEGTYNMGDGETPAVAEQRALILAKQNAIGQAGVYLENYCVTNNFQLKKDEIRTISSGIIKTTILDHGKTIQDKGGIQFWVKIKATVTTDNIKDMVKRMKDLSAADRYVEIENKFDTLQTDHLQNWNQADKAVVNEKEWLANYWLDLGINQFLIKDYINAIDSLTKSYNLNKNETSIILLGDVNYANEKYSDALDWYKKVTQTDYILFKEGISAEKSAYWFREHLNRGDIVPNYLNEASTYYYKILIKNRNNAKTWVRYGIIKDQFIFDNHYESPILYYKNAINLNPNFSDPYYYRGIDYEKMNQPYEAAQDYKKFLELIDSTDENYKDAKTRLQALKDKYGIM